MSRARDQIQALIDSFVGELMKVIKTSAVAPEVDGVRAARGASRRTRSGSAGDASRTGGRAVRRSAAEVASTTDSLLTFITEHPGLSAEGIAKGLDVSTRELVLPIKRLVMARALAVEGKTRATRYFPAAKPDAAAAEKPAPSRRKPRRPKAAAKRRARKR